MKAKGIDPCAQLSASIFKVFDPDKPEIISTGFFVTEDGDALTCYHVARGDRKEPPDFLTIEYKGEKYQAQFIRAKSSHKPDYESGTTDVAVLKVKKQDLEKRGGRIVPVHLGRQYKPDDPIVVLGFHRQYRKDEADPIYGHVDKYNPIQQVKFPMKIWGQDVTVRQSCLIITLDQYPWEEGQSGAPVLNKRTGRVIAIATGKRDPSAYWPSRGYAIPLTDVCESWPEFEKLLPLEEPGHYPGIRIVHDFTLPNWVGREKELEELISHIRDNTHPVISIVALGGTGKSWLTRKLVEELPKWGVELDGVLWFSFYVEHDFDRFLEEACDWLLGQNFDKAAYPSSYAKVALLKRELERRRCLLVLDGIETMLEERKLPNGRENPRFGACKDRALREFLRGMCAQFSSQLLITSRWVLADLASEERHLQKDLSDLSPSEAVAFMQRLGVKGDPCQIAKVCKHYGNHVLTLRVLAGFLVRNYGGNIEAMRYFQGIPASSLQGFKLQSILDSVWESLTPEERFFMTRLSAFRGGVTEDVLELLTQGDSTDPIFYEMISRLKDAALLTIEMHGVKNVYTTHPLLKAYFYDRMSAQEKLNTHLTLKDYATRLPIPHQPRSLDDLSPLIETYHHCLKAELYEQAYELFGRSLMRPLFYWGQYDLALSLLEPLVDASSQKPSLWKPSIEQKCFLRVRTGMFLSYSGRLSEAKYQLKEAIELQHSGGSMLGEAAIWRLLCDLHIKTGDFDDALAALDRADALMRWLEADPEVAPDEIRPDYSLGMRGIVHAQVGESKLAIEEFSRALDLVPSNASPLGKCYWLLARGDLYVRLRDLQNAQEDFQHALLISQRPEFQFRSIEGRALLGLGDCHYATNGHKTAQEYYSQAFDIATGTGNRYLEAEVLIHFAWLTLQDSDYEKQKTQTQEYAGRALLISHECGFKVQATEAHLLLARVALGAADTASAQAHYKAACEIVAKTQHYWTGKELEELKQLLPP